MRDHDCGISHARPPFAARAFALALCRTTVRRAHLTQTLRDGCGTCHSRCTLGLQSNSANERSQRNQRGYLRRRFVMHKGSTRIELCRSHPRATRGTVPRSTEAGAPVRGTTCRCNRTGRSTADSVGFAALRLATAAGSFPVLRKHEADESAPRCAEREQEPSFGTHWAPPFTLRPLGVPAFATKRAPVRSARRANDSNGPFCLSLHAVNSAYSFAVSSMRITCAPRSQSRALRAA